MRISFRKTAAQSRSTCVYGAVHPEKSAGASALLFVNMFCDCLHKLIEKERSDTFCRVGPG